MECYVFEIQGEHPEKNRYISSGVMVLFLAEEARAKLHERLATEKELFAKLKAVREEFQSFTDLGRSLKPKEIAQRNLVARRLIKSAHEHAEVVMDIEFFEFLSR